MQTSTSPRLARTVRPPPADIMHPSILPPLPFQQQLANPPMAYSSRFFEHCDSASPSLTQGSSRWDHMPAASFPTHDGRSSRVDEDNSLEYDGDRDGGADDEGNGLIPLYVTTKSSTPEESTSPDQSLVRRRRRGPSVSESIIEDDDPRVTGDAIATEQDDMHMLSAIDTDIDTANEDAYQGYELRVKFLLILAKCLMRFGSPTHRLESQLVAISKYLELNVQFTTLPDIVIVGFGPDANQSKKTLFLREAAGIDLSRLQRVHKVYRNVMHEGMHIFDAVNELEQIVADDPVWSKKWRLLFSFVTAFILCIMAFHGSTLDALVSGICAVAVAWAQQSVARNSPLHGSFLGICIGIPVAFLARGLSSIQSQLFCYDAISSSGVVMVLPGYAILCSALELASKNFRCGSVRLVYAIIVSLFVGLSLTIGSDLYLLIDAGARHRRDLATQGLAAMLDIHGYFNPDNTTLVPFAGEFAFRNATSGIDISLAVEGCFRDPNRGWYLQEIPWWSLFFLVPIFSLLSSLANMQPLRGRALVLMVLISCASFAANTAANRYIFERSDVVSAIGGFVVGILGNLASRFFRVTAFSVMITGVLFLVPSGLSATGGMAQNYRGGDQYLNGLQIGVNMVKVSIGITIGLICSGALIYSFGRKKHGGSFAL